MGVTSSITEPEVHEDGYLTVGQLRNVIEGLPDHAKVFYERIEDVYFTKNGWEADKYIKSDFTEPSEAIFDEYLRVFCAFKDEDGDLCITAHY